MNVARLSLLLGVVFSLTLTACDQAEPSFTTSPGAAMGNAGTSGACANRNNNTTEKLLECVTLGGVRRHQEAFQNIADANGGTRAAGTPGYTASADYVASTLADAGWNVERVAFTYPFTDVLLQQLTPNSDSYETGAFTGSGEGDVTAAVVPVDINLTDPANNTSGCEVADFALFPVGAIALIQRGGGTCFFARKATYAQDAGASAVVIFNEGTPGREGLIVGTAANLEDGTPSDLSIPVVGASFADGVALSQPGSTARVLVDFTIVPSENIIAEKPGKEGDAVVVVGANLDSVTEGPGINDNASGSAALLETAVQMARVKPHNTLRLAWWGAKELELRGSQAYVDGLSTAERDAIAAYLNFDRIGSPNFVRFIYDGDGSETGSPGPEGSASIEAFFEAFYADRGLPWEPIGLGTVGSDHFNFLVEGIPVGGLFTGSEVIKTDVQAAVYGGTAGEQYDPCYHLACDTYDNVGLQVLDLNADAVAAAALTFAMDETLGVAARPAPAGPALRAEGGVVK